jgi:16S rRNA processing protein RimM
MTRVCLGVVVGVHGVQGAVKVKSFTEVPADVGSYGPVEDEAGQRRFRVKVIGSAKGVVVATLEGIRDRNAAEALKGTRLYVPRERLPQPEDEDEVYLSDLIGLRAELEDGTAWGTVKAVYDFGAGDVLEVARPDGRLDMLPFTRTCVPVLEVANGRLVVAPPEEIEVRSPEQAGEQGGTDA